ncbi:hypothetical protein [Intestinirhabdus alba]|uniref:hypothetical protein n=1 Tax=Intestinirhabdus alba TaxID=2899544 RepID=UPI001ADF294A|nr:hypothetical protein [Intestinirhabdus alba]
MKRQGAAKRSASSIKNHLFDSLSKRIDRLYPDYPVRICPEYGARILKDRYVWPGDWPLSLRNASPGF